MTRYMAEILPIQRKTLSNQSINQSINQLINQSIKDSHTYMLPKTLNGPKPAVVLHMAVEL